ncbi:alpha-L-arabinofuranosidase b, catalytic domain-containing protein [Sarocladium implicatum]|nr:alpha-L-arabinofuranosidase b, catalytic domain-containing protein [Sarocladium implicatum]
MPSYLSTKSAIQILAAAGLAAAGPCDIYAKDGAPCVAAHSTTRALYSSFSKALYQLTRNSDGATTDISPLSAGGVADASAHDSFCNGATCLVSIIYDQSGRGNHLTRAPPGGAASGPNAGGYDDLAAPLGAPVTLNGKKAYGVFVSPGTGYRNNKASGTATGDEPEGMYAVLDGTHYNGGCCFDYGNAETNSHDTGNGHMEAIYFGDNTVWGTGSGSGPWIMADLENGLFSGENVKQNTNDPTITNRFLTAVVKGEPNHWAIRGGNAVSGDLSTFYDGVRPNANGYNPMHKEGAIILGIGGDNSIGAQGTFYEGVMTSGYPSDSADDQVQADVVSAGYAVGALSTGTKPTVGSSVTLHVTTPGYTNRYLAHDGTTVDTQVLTSSSSSSARASGTWVVRTGLANSQCFSFESTDTKGSFIRHSNFKLLLNSNDGSKQFSEDATFCTQPGISGKGTSFRAWGYPSRYFRHYNNVGYLASQGGPEDFDNKASWANDVSFIIGSGFS